MLIQTEELMTTGKKEIEILSMFSHPNILRIVDHDIIPSRQVPGAQEILMLLPFHKRGSIQDALDYQRARFGVSNTVSPFTEKEVLTLFKAICSAIALFHQSDPPLALRDLKPGNVLLSDLNEPVLMDFGSVTEARISITSRQQALSIQENAEILCTPQYPN